MSLAPIGAGARAIQAEIEAFLFDGVPGAASSAFTRNEARDEINRRFRTATANVTRSRHSDYLRGRPFDSDRDHRFLHPAADSGGSKQQKCRDTVRAGLISVGAQIGPGGADREDVNGWTGDRLNGRAGVPFRNILTDPRGI